MINIQTEFVLNTTPDSLYQRSPTGISYRIPVAMVNRFNKLLTEIGKEAAEVAASNTPFSYLQNEWAVKFAKGGRYGIINEITVYNKKANGYITYRSKYSNSGRKYRFYVRGAIAMMEKGRKGGYTIAARRAEALTLPPIYAVTRKNGHTNLSKDKKAAFFTEVTGGSLPATRPLSKALRYMKSKVEGAYTDVGAYNYSSLGTAKKSTYTSVPRATRGSRRR